VQTAELLRDIVVLLAASLPIVVVFHRIRVPALVGFIVAGTVIGPSASGLIHSTETADVLAEIGVVLLLFTIGLDFSLAEITLLRRYVLGAGTIQVVVTITAVGGLCRLYGLPPVESAVVGSLVALSSTVIALKVLSDQAEVSSPHGRAALGVLLFQDLCVLPMMLVLPELSRPDGIAPLGLVLAFGKGLLAMAAIFYGARFLLPRLLNYVVALRLRELLVATVVVFCLGTAWIASQLGVSLAIGAFIAGLVISESEYSHQVVAEILPFRDLFNSIFFISIGMLLDLGYLAAHLPAILGVTVLVIVLKSALGGFAVFLVQGVPRVAFTVGLILGQIGEFSFVLAGEAARLETASASTLQTVLSVSALTMIAGPFLIAAAPRLSLLLFRDRVEEEVEQAVAPRLQVLVIGYGLNGQNLARVLRETGLSYAILELNAESVRRAAERGEPILFGDGTRAGVLRHARAHEAAVIVVAISDPGATRRMVAVARQVSPAAVILVRTRYVNEIEDLYRAGADEVIAEEFETSVEIFARVLHRLHVPSNVIATQIGLVRDERYAMLRGLDLGRRPLQDIRDLLEATTTEVHLVRPQSHAAGRSILELELRSRTGVTVIAIVRHGKSQTNPPPDFRIEAGDVLVMLGSHAELVGAGRYLETGAGA
jgi:CPA2 family monovalent cation:H+ antiporter-2